MTIHVPGHLKPSENGWYMTIRTTSHGPIYSADLWEQGVWTDDNFEIICAPLTFCGPFQDPQTILEAQYKRGFNSLKEVV